MRYVTLNGLDVKLSCLGLGCEQLGGHGWGKTSETEIVKAIYRALDRGVIFFDTAPIYGLGHSEEVLGRTLAPYRKNVVLATKVGLAWREDSVLRKTAPDGPVEKFTDGSPANITREIEASLRRLKTDYIDLYQVHWPDSRTPIGDTLFAMEKLRQSGKIRCIGCCNFSLELLKEAIRYVRIATLQVPYSLIDRKAEKELLPFCRENNISVIAYSPLARGLLSGKYGKGSRFEPGDHRNRGNDEYFCAEAFARNLEIVERVKAVSRRLHKTPSQIALRWVLENPGITVALFGAKNVAQVEENVSAADFDLSGTDMEALNREIPCRI